MFFLNWLLVSEPGKSSLGGIFDIFGFGTKAFKETGPEVRSPGRDLHFGSKKSRNHLEKRYKKAGQFDK